MRSGPLWLDEALSVEIARLPLSELPEALRQDGAPPVYYLLLHGWLRLVGEGTTAVRLLTVALVPVALLLAGLLGRRLGGAVGSRAGGRAAVVALAVLPWTMRYGSETRMYLLVVVEVLAGALLVERVRRAPGALPVAGLALVAGLLLHTHYWSLFLLAALGLVALVAALRGSAGDRRVVVGLVLGGLTFAAWLPTFLYQARRTGAPWADPLVLAELVRTPRYWGGGGDVGRTVLAVLLVALVAVGAARVRAARLPLGVAVGTLLLAFVAVYVGGGAYTGRYTAVAVPLVAVAAGLGAVSLGEPGGGSCPRGAGRRRRGHRRPGRRPGAHERRRRRAGVRRRRRAVRATCWPTAPTSSARRCSGCCGRPGWTSTRSSTPAWPTRGASTGSTTGSARTPPTRAPSPAGSRRSRARGRCTCCRRRSTARSRATARPCATSWRGCAGRVSCCSGGPARPGSCCTCTRRRASPGT